MEVRWVAEEEAGRAKPAPTRPTSAPTVPTLPMSPPTSATMYERTPGRSPLPVHIVPIGPLERIISSNICIRTQERNLINALTVHTALLIRAI